MLKKLILFSLAVVFFSSCENQAKKDDHTLKTLNEYLHASPDRIQELQSEISAQAAKQAEQEIHSFIENKLKTVYRAEWDSMKLVYNDKELRFKYRKFGEKPPQGWSLYISMHGGGNTAPEMNNQQWQNQINLYRPKEGIYLAPRAPTNTWNLWHEPHIDVLFSQLIELADAFEDINTNRVYLTGYSAGGDGTYQLAPRMADQLAAAAMMAGHPNDASPLGLRNLLLPSTWELKTEPTSETRLPQNGKPNWIPCKNRTPKATFTMCRFTKAKALDGSKRYSCHRLDGTVYPQSVPAKSDLETKQRNHDRFYWLAVPAGSAQKDAEVIATLNGQTITIEKAQLVDTLLIRLNDKMINLDQKVKVFYNGQLLYDAVPVRNVATIWKSLSERNDPEQVFSAQIEVHLK